MKTTRALRALVVLACLTGLVSKATATTSLPKANPSCSQQMQTGIWSDTLQIAWKGLINDPMSECIWSEFEKSKDKTRAVLLSLDSPGGYLPAMEKTVSVLRTVRKTHLLATMVDRGAVCGSACVPVFLAGQRRWGALTSSWLFHEVGRWTGEDRKQRTTDRTLTERILQDYFLAAGVSEKWLNRVRPVIQHADYWQTGRDLWESRSRIITHPIDNLTSRGTERRIY